MHQESPNNALHLCHLVVSVTCLAAARRRRNIWVSKMAKLSTEEKILLESVDAGEWHSIRSKKKESERFQVYAKETFRKDRRVNIRMAGRDLEAIQKRAMLEGIPYQTLIASILLLARYESRDSRTARFRTSSYSLAAACVCFPQRHGPSRAFPASIKRCRSRNLVGSSQRQLASYIQV